MNKRSFFIILSICLFALFISGCSKDAAWQRKLSGISSDNKYAVLYIDNENSAESAALKRKFQENVNNMPDKFQFVEVNYKRDKDSLLKYFNASSIDTFPMILSIAPSGAITGSFTKECTQEDLKATIVSTIESEVLSTLQNGKVALLCLYDGETKKFSDVKKSLTSVQINYKGMVVSHYIDTKNDSDKEFVNKLPEVKGNITVMITAPPGNILAMLTDDEITLTSLLSTIQSTCSSGSCGPAGCG